MNRKERTTWQVQATCPVPTKFRSRISPDRRRALRNRGAIEAERTNARDPLDNILCVNGDARGNAGEVRRNWQGRVNRVPYGTVTTSLQSR